MTRECEFIGECGFINSLAEGSGIRRGWTLAFCGSKEKSAACYRKICRKSTGRHLAANVAPTGQKSEAPV